MKTKSFENHGIKDFFKNILKSQGYAIVFLIVWLFGMIFVKNFASLANNAILIKQAAIPIIACLGMTLVLMTGGIDLSVGYICGLGCYLSGMFVISWNLPVAISIILTIVVGLFFGTINGVLVQKFKIPSFIVTLGTGYITYGIAQIASNGTAFSSMPKEFLAVGRTILIGMPASVWIALIVIIIFTILMHFTKYGRYLGALGLNEDATKMSGIRTDWIIFSAYAVCGACASLAGLLTGIRVNNASPVMGGSDFTFTAITAAVLGGASLTGGKGTAYGAVLGMMTIVMIENIINLLGIDPYVFQAVLSIVILLAITFENIKNRIMQ